MCLFSKINSQVNYFLVFDLNLCYQKCICTLRAILSQNYQLFKHDADSIVFWVQIKKKRLGKLFFVDFYYKNKFKFGK
jgi:hypothetical protein